MKIKYFSFLLVLSIIAIPLATNAALADKLAGRILLQVQQKGEAWFVHPTNLKRYYLGNPTLMLQSMQKLGVGVNNEDLKNIPIGLIETKYQGSDSDGDGLADDLETAIETDINKADSDGDGFDDYTEVKNGYNPLGEGKMVGSGMNLNAFLVGNILLQVQQNGEAWYYNPLDEKRYFLGRPEQALEIVRNFGLGITDADLDKITNSQTQTESSDIKNCGVIELIFEEDETKQQELTSNWLKVGGCFLDSFKTCKEAKMQLNSFGSTEYIYDIVGSDGDKCRIKEYYTLVEPLAQDLMGKDMICTYNQDRGLKYFEELANGTISFSSSDPAYEKCEGELAEHLQR